MRDVARQPLEERGHQLVKVVDPVNAVHEGDQAPLTLVLAPGAQVGHVNRKEFLEDAQLLQLLRRQRSVRLTVVEQDEGPQVLTGVPQRQDHQAAHVTDALGEGLRVAGVVEHLQGLAPADGRPHHPLVGRTAGEDQLGCLDVAARGVGEGAAAALQQEDARRLVTVTLAQRIPEGGQALPLVELRTP